MSPEWMLQALLAAALLGLGALAAERVAGWFAVPRRSVWAAAMLGSLLLPALSLWAPGVLPDPGIFPVAAAPLPALDVGALPPFAGGPGAPVGGAVADAPAWRTDPTALLGLGWLAASLAVLGVVGWTYRRLRRARERGVAMDLDGGEVRVTEHAGPAVVGLLHPAIVVPRWVLDAPGDERRLILLHEREHVAAGDAWLLFFATLAVAAMPWSVPLWWQHRRLRAAVETDCDARVLARGASRREYGQVLIRTAGSTPGLPLLGPAWGDSTSQLERRIIAMTTKRPSHRLLRSVPLLALAAAVATTACDVAVGTEAETSLTTEPPSVSASLRVGVAAGVAAGERGSVTDTVPPLPPLPPLAPAAPAPPPPPDSTPLAPPPPDAPAPPALVAPPAPGAQPARAPRPSPAAPPDLPAPAAPAARSTPVARPTAATPRAAPTAGRVDQARQRARDTMRTITGTVPPDPSRPARTARTGFQIGFRMIGSPDGARVVGHTWVSRVLPGTGAARAGLRAGDVILAVNGADARAPGSLGALVTQQPGTRYVLRIRRGAEELDVVAELDPAVGGERIPA